MLICIPLYLVNYFCNIYCFLVELQAEVCDYRYPQNEVGTASHSSDEYVILLELFPNLHSVVLMFSPKRPCLHLKKINKYK